MTNRPCILSSHLPHKCRYPLCFESPPVLSFNPCPTQADVFQLPEETLQIADRDLSPRGSMVRSAPKGRQQMGETGFCENLRVSAVSCENLRFPVVFCENLRPSNPLIHRASRKSAKICKNLRKCAFWVRFLPFAVSLLARPEWFPTNLRNEKERAAERGSFRAGYPTHIRGSFGRMSRVCVPCRPSTAVSRRSRLKTAKKVSKKSSGPSGPSLKKVPKRSFLIPKMALFRRLFGHLVGQCEIPPHIAQYPFEIVSQRGVSHPFLLFS